MSRRNAGMSLNLAASLLGVKSSLKSWENDRSRFNVVALAGLLYFPNEARGLPLTISKASSNLNFSASVEQEVINAIIQKL